MENKIENGENKLRLNGYDDSEELPEYPGDDEVEAAFQSGEDESESAHVLSKSIFDEWEEERALIDEPLQPVKLKFSTVILLMAVMALEFVWGVMPYVALGMVESSPLARHREMGEDVLVAQINEQGSYLVSDPSDEQGVILADEGKLNFADSFRLTSFNDGVTGITEEESDKEETDSTNKGNTEDDSKSESFNATIVTPPINITIVGGGSSSGVVEGTVTNPGGSEAGDHNDKYATSPSDSYVVTITPSIEYTEVKVEGFSPSISIQHPDTVQLGFYNAPLSALGNSVTIRLICLLKLITGLKLKEPEVDDVEEKDEEYAA